jgi:hypothetical protein
MMGINELKVGDNIKTLKDVSVNIELFSDMIDFPHHNFTWHYLVEYVSIDYVIVQDVGIGSYKRLLLSSSKIELDHE